MKTESKQLNVSDMASDIRNIINESYRESISPDATERFKIDGFVNRLLSTVKDQKLTSYLTHMNERLNRGAKHFMVFEEFGRGLQPFSTFIEVRNVLDEMNKIMQDGDNAKILESFKISEMVNDEYVHDQLVESLNAYYANPNDFTKKEVNDAIDNMHNLNETALAVNLSLIVNDIADAHKELFSSVSINESHQIAKKQQSVRDEQIQKNIFEKVERYIANRLEESEISRQRVAEQYTLKNVSNKMGLSRSIASLMKSDAAKNPKLNEKLQRFSYALQQGCYEERIYESFITQITPFNYLKDVDKVIKRINEKAAENPDTLLLTRILEEMSESADSYIYREMIEEDVCRFIQEPTAENRIQVLNACMPYATNPYINKILETVYRISDKRFAGSISEQALSIKDQISMIKENVSVYNLYSPVLYIKENQSVFAIGNTFYVKNGNNIAPLDKTYIPKLDEKFVQLAHLVNNPAVTVQDDRIYLAGEDMWATVYEDRVIISDGNGEYQESQQSLRRLDEMCMKYSTYGNTEFFIMASCLLENFNNIASLGFAKKVVMNGNNDVCCELFRLDENIFLATHNYQVHQNTFYRNVNPIFARNTINEHFGINVGQIFEDLLPDQDKIVLQLFETKSEYEKSIEEYEQMIQDLNDAKENANSTDMEKELDAAIAEAEEKLEEVKKEYREWQDQADETLEGDTKKEDDDEDNVTREVSNEPLDKDEVEDHTEELSEPLTNDAADDVAPADEAGSEVPVVTDDEFSEFMAQDATDDAVNPDETEEPAEEEVDADETEEVPAEETAPDYEVSDTVSIMGDEEDDDASFADGDIFDEEPKENQSDDEDIITDTAETADDNDDIFIEEPTDDMTVMDVNDNGEAVEAGGTEATDLFGGDTENPLEGVEEEPVASNELFNPNIQTSEFNIVNVMFDENVKNNTVSKSGQVLALKPMVDADGRKFVEETIVKFYLNDDNTPVIENTDSMSTAMYNAIVSAIKSDPSYANVCANGLAVGGTASAVEPIAAEETSDETWEQEYDENGNAEDELKRQIAADDVIEEPVETDNVAIDEEPADEPVVAADAPVVPVADIEEFSIDDLFGDDEPASEETPAPVTPAENEVIPVAPAKDVVDTYTDPDGTEIEVPAPAEGEETPENTENEPEKEDDAENKDESIIPENHKRTVTKQQINENRKAILSVKSKAGK